MPRYPKRVRTPKSGAAKGLSEKELEAMGPEGQADLILSAAEILGAQLGIKVLSEDRDEFRRLAREGLIKIFREKECEKNPKQS